MQWQHIEQNGIRYVLVPEEAFDELNDLNRVDKLRTMLAHIKSGKEETFPPAFSKKLSEALQNGNSLLPIWREYRGYTQQTLSERSGIKRDYISMIETGKREGSLSTMKALATALTIDLDDLV